MIEGIAKDLSLDCDGDVSQSDKDDIGRYLNEGRCLIASLNPSFYAVRKTFKLDAGSVHDLCECENITKVHGQTDDGCIVTDSAKFPTEWGCESGKDKGKFKLRSIKAGVDYITAKPPVPEGVDVHVMVSCTPKELGDATSEKNLSKCSDAMALSEWALYRGTLKDSDGEGLSIQVAQLHLRAFLDLTNIKNGALRRQLREAGVKHGDLG